MADTNNHAIRVIDLDRNTVSTLQLFNAQLLAATAGVTVVGGNRQEGILVRLPPQTVAAGAGQIVFDIRLPNGYKLNPLAESRFSLTSSAKSVKIEEADSRGTIASLTVAVPARLELGTATVRAELTIYYCEEGQQNVCLLDTAVVEAPVTVASEGGSRIIIGREVDLPELQGMGVF